MKKFLTWSSDVRSHNRSQLDVMLITLILFFIYSSTLAQEKYKSLEIHIGVGSIQLRENALGKIKHKGSITTIGFSIQKKFQKGMFQQIHLAFSHGALKSRFEDEKSSKYSHPILTFTTQIPIFSSISIGGYFSGGYQVMEFENWDDSHLYWLTSYELGSSIDFNLTKRFWAQLNFPLLSLVSRSRNEISNKVDSGDFSDIFKLINSDMRLTSLPNCQAFNLQVSWTLVDTGIIYFKINTTCQFIQISLPKSKELNYSSIIPGVFISYKFN